MSAHMAILYRQYLREQVESVNKRHHLKRGTRNGTTGTSGTTGTTKNFRFLALS